jgi:hypothetical protein
MQRHRGIDLLAGRRLHYRIVVPDLQQWQSSDTVGCIDITMRDTSTVGRQSLLCRYDYADLFLTFKTVEQKDDNQVTHTVQTADTALKDM